MPVGEGPVPTGSATLADEYGADSRANELYSTDTTGYSATNAGFGDESDDDSAVSRPHSFESRRDSFECRADSSESRPHFGGYPDARKSQRELSAIGHPTAGRQEFVFTWGGDKFIWRPERWCQFLASYSREILASAAA